ncbi:putative ribonuclease H-like domain-containing protein [Tanacetum coccineum]|uniref:Ribonuclease H-like domain-containing protein n=1 Tax=Tanacetum coccineum TaxID=301880 RepID=A0ABQ5HIA4_9ASTR
MDLETTQTTTTAKLPILNQGEYDMWRLRIEQYFHVQDYALWDVIENGNSFKPATRTTTNADGTSTSLIPGPITTEENVQKKNDVKARSMLLMALSNEHLMTFNQYKDAKTLFATIQTRFGVWRNKSDLETMSFDDLYNNFKIVEQEVKRTASSSLSSQNMDFMSSPINTNEVNTAYGVSTTNTQVILASTQVSTASTQALEDFWRNKSDLETMSFDDLYNNFKIVEQEVKRTASSSLSSQNMDFMSSPINTNEVNTAYGVSTTNTQVILASTQVSTASTQVSTNNLSDDTVYAFLASQPNRSQLVYEDLEQIDEDDIEKTYLKCDTAGYDKSKVECFNCHKMGNFARECKGSRNQDSRNMNQDNSRRTINVEETSSKAMVAIDGASFDWSYMADDEVLTNMALMAFSDSEEFQQPEFEGYGPKPSKNISENISNEVRESLYAPLVEELMSDDKLEKKTIFSTVAKIEFVRPKQQEKPVRKPVKYAEMYRNRISKKKDEKHSQTTKPDSE